MSLSSLPPISTSAHDVPRRPAIQQRKVRVRKGTFSCWECKHRKSRCEFKPIFGSTCVSCHRRGLPCISQEFAETEDSGYDEVEKRIVHIEGLVSQLVRQRIPRPQRAGACDEDGEIPDEPSGGTPGSTRRLSAEREKNIISPLSSLFTDGQDPLSKCRSLSGYLHLVLPHPTTAVLILSRSKYFSLPFQILRQPSRSCASSSRDSEQLAQVSKLPSPTAHPVHFARKLIQLALCLQRLEATASQQQELQLHEPVHDAARRYVDIASRYVTSQDLLVHSLDGLETLMLEGYYHISAGNPRIACHIFRRAVGIAQLMGLHRMIEKACRRVRYMLFRLIHSDCFISLMLGLPFAIANNAFVNEDLLAVDVPAERLERIHVVAVGRIIARNLLMQRNRSGFHHEESEGNSYDDYEETQDIDYQLKRATRLLPATWWLLPTLNNDASDMEAMEESARLITQMHQYHLLVVLHQPYLIHRPYSQPTAWRTYSKLAAISASREVLSRFLMFRNFHKELPYRGVDYKGFTASMTLLLAHLDGHHLGRANVLEHQRLHDLGIIENTIKCIEEVSRLNKDVPGSSSAKQLRKLLEIEADAADGADYCVWIEEDGVVKEHCNTRREEHSLELPILYFGTICIVRKGQKGHQLACPDSDSFRRANIARGLLTGTEYNNPGQANGNSPFTIEPSVYGGIAAFDSQLQLPVPACPALNFDDSLTVQSFMDPRIQVMSQPPESTLPEMSLPEQTADAQDYSYQEVDPVFFYPWIQGEARTDEPLEEM